MYKYCINSSTGMGTRHTVREESYEPLNQRYVLKKLCDFLLCQVVLYCHVHIVY